MKAESSGKSVKGRYGRKIQPVIHILFVCFILAIAVLPAAAEGPYDIYWKAQLGTAGTDTAYAVAGDGTGNLYVVGKTTGGTVGLPWLDGNTYQGGASDAFLVKYDINGAKACSALIGTTGDDAANGVAVDGSGNVYVVGSTSTTTWTLAGTGPGGGTSDMFLAKLDSNCLNPTIVRAGSSAADIAWAVTVSSTGDIFVTGETSGDFDGAGAQTAKGLKDIFISKFNSSLVQQYVVQAGTAANDIAYAILLDSNGDPNIVGETSGDLDGAGTQTAKGLKDMFWAKYASSTFTVMAQIGTASDDVANGIAQDDLGNIYIAGYSSGNLGGTGNAGGKDIVVTKYNSTGTQQWLKQFGTASDDTAEGLTSDTTTGEVYIVGATAGSLSGYTLSGTSDAFVAKYDNAGTQMWVKQLGTSMADSSWAVVYDAGLLYIAGETTGDFSGTNAGGIDLIAAYLSTDQSAPNTTIATKPNSFTNSSSATFTFSCADYDPITNTNSLPCANGTFMCKLGSAPLYSSCTSPKTYTGLTSGAYSFLVYAVDASGNPDGTPASASWTVDMTPPVSTISTFTNPTNDNTPAFTFSSNQSGSTFECSLDTGTPNWVTCTSPYTFGTVLSPVPDGTYTFRVRATDLAGNLEITPQTATLVIDTVAPLLPTLGGCPASITNVGSYTFTFSSASPDIASYWYAKNGSGTFTQTTSPYSYSETVEGAKSFSIKAKDLAGNFSAVQSCSWVYDKTAPITTILTKPTSPSNDDTPTYTFSANQTGSTFECSLDTGTPSWFACTSPYIFGTTADGVYTFRIRATDPAGNVETTPKTAALTIDTAIPVLTTTPACPSLFTNVAAVSFSFASTNTDLALQPYWCSKDGATFVSCTSPQSYTAAIGARSFSVKAKDLAGNFSATSTCNWTLDTAKPITTITVKPASPSKDNTPTFTFAANEISTFECSLDTGTPGWVACTSPHTFGITADGAYTFRVRATDRAGNIETIFGTNNTASITIDTTAPSAPTITSAPSNPSKVINPSFNFTAEAGAKFMCELPPYAAVACISGKAYSNLSQGSHTFTVWAIDAAGNGSKLISGTSHTWVIDSLAPDTQIDTTPLVYSNSGTGTFEFSSADATASFECRLTPATTYSSCSSPYTYGSVTQLSNGTYTFYVRAKDPAGNVDSTPASYSFTVDKTAPNTFIGIKPSLVSTDPTPRFTFTSSESLSTFECSIDGAAYSVCTVPYQVVTALTAGAHDFSVRSIDRAGNTDSTPATYSWTVDTSKPNATITSKPAYVTKNTSATFTFTANMAGSTFECSLDNAPYAACTSPKAYAGPLTEGPHTFEVRAKNSNGTGSSDVWPWTIDLTAPDVSITVTPTNPSNDTTPTFEFSSTDATATFLCNFDAATTYVACASPYTSASALPSGLHTFRVKSKDQAGNISAPVTHSWTVDSVRPETVIDSKPALKSNDNTPTFAFHSPDATATFECALDGGTTPSWTACISPVTYSSALANGTHTFKVRAKDPAGNIDGTPSSYTWTIDTVAPNTTITIKPTNPSASSVSFSFTSSETSSTFECMMSPATTYSSCTSPASYTGLTVGSHTFRVRAKDAAGNVDGSPAIYTWTVQ